MKRSPFILALLLLPGLMQAQEPSHAAKRRMNALVLDALEKYEAASPVSNPYTKAGFITLFYSRSIPVFCDIYNSPHFLSALPAYDYCDEMIERCDNVQVELKNIRKGNVLHYNGAWHYIVTFDKFIGFCDSNAVLFPFQDTLAQDFHIEIVYHINEKLDRCLIENIRCLNEEEYRTLSDAYIVRLHPDKETAAMDRQVAIGGKRLAFNRFDQAYSPKGEVEFWDNDVEVRQTVITSTDLYEYIEFQYIPKHLRLKLRGGIAPGGSYSVSAPEGFTGKSPAGYEADADIGYAFPVAGLFKAGVSAGIGASYAEIRFEDGSMSHSSRNIDLLLPLYANAEISPSNNLSLFAEAGAKTYFSASSAADSFRYGKSPVYVSLAGNLGVDVNLYRNWLFFEAEAGYEYGLMSYQFQKNPLLSFRRQAAWFHLGLMLKL